MLNADIEKNNKERIKYLVKEHFSLSEDSYKFFSNEIESKTLLKVYKDFLEKNHSTDLRASFELPIIYREKLDNGWKLFINSFSHFCMSNNVSYENFVSNKITINKNNIKLRKAIISFYTKKENIISVANNLFHVSSSSSLNVIKDLESKIIEIIDNILLEVSKICLPKSSIKMVVSLNFADWFLCSTAENWRSCLNLESDFHASYWAGLPGLIGDKNRCMIYITDGNLKTYQGITVERIIARSWGMVGNNNKLYVIKPYPLANLFDYKTLKEVTGLDTEYFSKTSDYISKEPVDLLYFNCKDAKKTSFIFQDIVGFHPEHKGTIIYYGKNGFYVYVNDKLNSGKQIINYSNGFSSLIKNNEKIEKYFIKSVSCDLCGSISERESMTKITFFDENINQKRTISVCRNCIREISSCNICGTIYKKNTKKLKIINDDRVCPECFEKHFFECEDCGNFHKKIEAKIIKDKYGSSRKICKKCFEDWYSETYDYCRLCGNYYHKSNLEINNSLEVVICKNCLKHDLTLKQFYLKL